VSGGGVVLSPPSTRSLDTRAQQRTTVTTNELDALLIHKEGTVKLVGFLGTQAIYPLVFLAEDALWPMEDGVPSLVQFSFEGGPLWEL